MGGSLSGLWGELRRRRVVRAAAAYAAGAFVLLQLAEIVFPAFDVGNQAMRALVALVLSGFPVAVALSWLYDVTRGRLLRTPGGERPANEDAALEAAPTLGAVTAVVLGAAVMGYALWYAVLGDGSAADAPPGAIAVLPFQDMSPGGDHAYLGDGLAEEILNILAGVEGLRVAARTSSFAFRNASTDIRAIGDSLGVDHVLEGSVRREGNQVRITAQLIDTATGYHVWSENFDRTMDSLFVVQDEIAAAIADELRVLLDLTPTSVARTEPPPAAKDAYWRGRAAWSRRGGSGIPAAIRLFNEALAQDSSYAQAWAGLADSYALLPQASPAVDADDAWERAEEYARRAIRLAPELAEPYASLGLVLAFRGDRAGALRAFGDAVRRNGSYAPAYHWRANVLAESGQLEAALGDIDTAAELDPLSVAVAVDRGWFLLWAGRPLEAGAAFRRAVDMEFGSARGHLGSALAALAREEDVGVHMAMAQWAAVSSVPPDVAAAVAHGLVMARDQAVPSPEEAQRLEALVMGGVVPSGTGSALAALMGDAETALRLLERSVADRSWVEQFPLINTAYDGLRERPEFRHVVATMRAGAS